MQRAIVVFLLLLISCHKEKEDIYIQEFDHNQYYCLILNKIDKEFKYKDDFGVSIDTKGAKIKFISNTVIEEVISKGADVIPALIVEYKYDSNFGIVIQKPIYEIPKWGKVRPSEFDKLIEEFKIYNYWIILKKKNEIYGPLSRENYLILRKELKVPSSLKFENNILQN